jgi:hypothetical protein
MANGDGQVEFQSPTTGKVQAVQPEHWEEAMKQGYKPTSHTVMYSQEDERGMVPNAEVHERFKAGYRLQPKLQYEKEHPGKGISLEGSGTAAWNTLKGAVPGDPTGGHSIFSKEAWLGEGPKFDPAHSGIATAWDETKAGWQRGGSVPGKLMEASSSGLGSLFNLMSGKKAAEHAERGEGGAIIGEAAVPAALTLAGAAVPEIIGRMPETSAGRIVKSAMKPKIEVLSEEHALAAREAEAGYQKELTAHKENVQAIKAEHTQATREFASAEELKGHQQKLASTVGENLKLADKRIAQKIGGEFEAVNDAIEKKNPQVEVTNAEREARGKLFFPDSVKAFDNIMENFQSKLGMNDFSILRKTYSRLNEVLYAGSDLPTDLYQAVKTVRDSLGKDLQSAATKAGQGERFNRAMKRWSDFQNDWHDTTAAAKGGSQISKILQAADPQFVIDQLSGKTGERIINTLKKYGGYGADSGLAERLRTLSDRLKKAPKPRMPETPRIPAPPERPQLEPFNRQATKEQLAAQRLKKIIGTGIVGAGGAYAYEKIHGGHLP